jgi:hypothetical protein
LKKLKLGEAKDGKQDIITKIKEKAIDNDTNLAQQEFDRIFSHFLKTDEISQELHKIKLLFPGMTEYFHQSTNLVDKIFLLLNLCLINLLGHFSGSLMKCILNAKLAVEQPKLRQFVDLLAKKKFISVEQKSVFDVSYYQEKNNILNFKQQQRQQQQHMHNICGIYYT